MRPWEYYDQHYPRHLNNRLEAQKQSIGLLCSFQNRKSFSWKWCYRFDKLEDSIELLRGELDIELRVVGKDVSSVNWMEKVMEVILESHLLVVDVSDPRQNVLYELGIACSLRSADNVLIVCHEDTVIESSEIQQLQLLRYSDNTDLTSKVKEYYNSERCSPDVEAKSFLRTVHNKLSPGAMFILHFMIEKRLKNKNKWHCHYKLQDAEDPVTYLSSCVGELADAGLVKFKYAFNKGFEWALHPTELGKKYLCSERLLSFWYSARDVSNIQSTLTGEYSTESNTE